MYQESFPTSFVCYFLFCILEHNLLPSMIDLNLNLSALNPQIAVFCLTSKTSENWQSDFLALVFLTITDGPGDNGLLSVSTSGVDTIYASIIALYPQGIDGNYSFFVTTK